MSLNFTQINSLISSNIRGNTSKYSLADRTIDINAALDKVWSLAIKASNKWQLDDSNQTDLPIITTSLVSGQRDYAFTTDGSSNIILDVHKVMIKNPSGVFIEISPVDQQSEENMNAFWDGQNTTGTPTRYDKTGNSIFLDPIPSYNSSGGLKLFINREASYFTSSDTTKKPGFAGIFHEYLALRPSYMFAQRNGLENTSILRDEMVKMEREIEEYYGQRARDSKRSLKANVENTR